jgi:hypothetical protein
MENPSPEAARRHRRGAFYIDKQKHKRRFFMLNQKEELKLIRMNEVEATAINWLWYPYIPYGKITVIQGDPGDGNYESSR